MASDESPSVNSFKVELNKWQNSLENVRHQLVEQSLSEDLEKYQDELKQKHVEQIQKGKESIQQLNENLQHLKDQENVNKRIAEERSEELKNMKTSIETSMKKMKDTLQQNESTKEQLNTMSIEIEREQQLLIAQEKSTHLRLQELRKATTFYKDRLGITFKKIDDDHLQIIFSQIDPNKVDQIYFFVVKVNSANKYEVTDCQPVVPNLEEELVQKLNETNNFSKFVIGIRKAFKNTLY